MKNFKILGIDQSLSDTGICILTEKDHKLLSIKSNPDKSEFGDLYRCRYIRDEIDKILKENKFDLIVLEGFSYGSKGRKLFTIAALGFFIRDVLATGDNKILIPTPGQLKKFVAGKGIGIEKAVMMMKVLSNWGVEISNNNLADAFGLAKLGEAFLLENYKYKYQEDVVKELRKKNGGLL